MNSSKRVLSTIPIDAVDQDSRSIKDFYIRFLHEFFLTIFLCQAETYT